MVKLTSKYKTVAVVGYTAAVAQPENRKAHGGVCLLQARLAFGRTVGRKVNSTGNHQEIGRPFDLDKATLEHWQKIGE